jgi:hypothetical protein
VALLQKLLESQVISYSVPFLLPDTSLSDEEAKFTSLKTSKHVASSCRMNRIVIDWFCCSLELHFSFDLLCGRHWRDPVMALSALAALLVGLIGNDSW